MKWLTFENRLHITAELVAETGLRVGAGGETALATATDLPVMRTADGRPFIPGASLRGAVRSHIERIIRTFEPDKGNGKGACNPTRTQEWCLTSEKVRTLREKPDYDEQVYTLSCRVCRVFGSPWLASRVRFTDLPMLSDAELELRDSVAIDREKESVANKFDFEALPAGVRFQFELIAENLDDSETGLLLLAIRELEQGNILIGGFKGRGLGRVKLDNLTITRVDRSNLKQFLLTGSAEPFPTEAQNDCIKALFEALEGGGA